ncbi:transposase [Flavobacterium sp. ASV13]|uniref:transposase n=1 Tax=Flavobacterium sp. ASV13 TaxID=1506583 RepID=UPI001EE76E2E|nr:transposase [Flavobacterium sp. ASV13]
MSRKYKFGDKTGAYFISFATVFWIDVFTRKEYFGSIVESLDYCRKNKGMEIYGYCIMPSHIHLIFRSENGDPSGLIRDFKGFTSRKMLKAIEENPALRSVRNCCAKSPDFVPVAIFRSNLFVYFFPFSLWIIGTGTKSETSHSDQRIS